MGGSVGCPGNHTWVWSNLSWMWSNLTCETLLSEEKCAGVHRRKDSIRVMFWHLRGGGGRGRGRRRGPCTRGKGAYADGKRARTARRSDRWGTEGRGKRPRVHARAVQCIREVKQFIHSQSVAKLEERLYGVFLCPGTGVGLPGPPAAAWAPGSLRRAAPSRPKIRRFPPWYGHRGVGRAVKLTQQLVVLVDLVV